MAREFTYAAADTFVAIRVDVLFSGAEYYEQALARRVPHVLPGSGSHIEVLSCEDLILHKLLAGRAIDWADAVALLQENRDTLDVQYLQDSAAQLGVSSELSLAWQEAFPADPTN